MNKRGIFYHYSIKTYVFPILIIGILLSNGCVPPQEEILTEIQLDLKDPQLRKIYSYQDEAKIDSLLPLFKHNDPTYRYAAAMTMASIRDKKVLPNLALLLKDKVEKVRTAAAYAIGQIGDQAGESFLIQGFESRDTLGIYKNSNGTILEAIGKCGQEKSLEFLSTIKTYSAQDTSLLEGQAWGIYRYATKGNTMQSGTNKMVEFAGDTDLPNSVRMIAANYLYRAKDIQLDTTQTQILALVLETEQDPRIRMTTAIALGKTKSTIAQKALTSQFAKEKDYRVKCNILRALGNFPYPTMQAMFYEVLNDPNITVATTAADFFINYGDARDATVYWRRARQTVRIPVKMQLYKAANRYMPHAYEDYKWLINNDLKLIFQDTTNSPYHRAEALRNLAEYNWNYKYINQEIGKVNNHPAIKTAAMEGLSKIVSDPKFDANFGVSRAAIKKEISVFIADALENGDTGVRAIAADLLSDQSLGFKELYTNSSFLYLAKRDLELPKETETLYALEKAIAYFDNKEIESTPPEFNHPIDWKILDGITANAKAMIKTKKGTITINFMPFAAPGSVANFIQLAKEGYYNQKNFHRVVPNFVIQGGCPRGDGYGGKNYTIRTEVPLLHYDKGGYVGMASAGKDTECTQWFITHSPAPHLDGKYTIFAKVTDGMDVVHQIEVGDTIESVTIVP